MSNSNVPDAAIAERDPELDSLLEAFNSLSLNDAPERIRSSSRSPVHWHDTSPILTSVVPVAANPLPAERKVPAESKAEAGDSRCPVGCSLPCDQTSSPLSGSLRSGLVLVEVGLFVL